MAAAGAKLGQRPVQVTVWGASGFTGRLVCEHLMQNYQVGAVLLCCSTWRVFFGFAVAAAVTAPCALADGKLQLAVLLHDHGDTSVGAGLSAFVPVPDTATKTTREPGTPSPLGREGGGRWHL
jgi:hypothetical protein